MNVEIRAVKTYLRAAAPGSTTLPSGAATYGLSASLVLLPKVPMQPRYFDPRVGYFTNDHIDYDADPQGVKQVNISPAGGSNLKRRTSKSIKAGELVEPQKPIVIYIDPATPKKWVPYLIQGVNDWQVAFEQAGFKNAIIGKRSAGGTIPPGAWKMRGTASSCINRPA